MVRQLTTRRWRDIGSTRLRRNTRVAVGLLVRQATVQQSRTAYARQASAAFWTEDRDPGASELFNGAVYRGR